MPKWVEVLSRVNGLWKDDKAPSVMSGEVGSAIPDEAMMIDVTVDSAPAGRTGGMCLGTAGSQEATRNVTAGGDTEVLEAKMKTSSWLGLRARIEHLMQMQNGDYHRCMANGDNALFTYLALSKANSNLAMPRRLRNVDDATLN